MASSETTMAGVCLAIDRIRPMLVPPLLTPPPRTAEYQRVEGDPPGLIHREFHNRLGGRRSLDSLEEPAGFGEPPVGDGALLGDACCRSRQERCQIVAERPDGLDQGREHAIEPLRGLAVAAAFGLG